MSQAPRDNNFRAVVLASDGTGTEPLRVDPATSRLLVEIHYVSSTTPATLSGKRDANFVPTGYAVTDDASEDLSPLTIDNRNGYLWVDIG